MKTGGEFTATQYDIKVASRTKAVPIVFVGDVHYGAPLHAAEMFAEKCAEWRSMKDAHFLLMGDYLDLASTSERKILASGLHDSTEATLHKVQRDMARAFVDKIKFMKGRVIGVINGNHYGTLADGRNSDQYIADQLDAPYLGTSALCRVRFEAAGKRTSITLCLNHGQGSGATPGGSINRVAKMVTGFDADVYAMGHNHALGAIPQARIYLTPEGVVKERKLWLLRTGSYLKAYDHQSTSYIADIMANPSQLGSPEIHARLRVTKSRGFHADLTAKI